MSERKIMKHLKGLARSKTGSRREAMEEYWRQRNALLPDGFTSGQRHDRDIYARQERILLTHLRGIPLGRVGEVGCGSGRITRLLLDTHPEIESIEAYDIAPAAIQAIRDKIPDPRLHASVGGFSDLAKHGRYDACFAVEVFMHIPPEDVQEALRLFLASAPLCVHIDWNETMEATQSGHCWQHDYSQIYKGWDVDYDEWWLDRQRLYRVWPK